MSLEIDWCIFDNFIEYQCFLSFRFYILQRSFVFAFASSCNAWIGKVKKYLSLLLAVYILRYFRLNEMFFRISPLYCIFNHFLVIHYLECIFDLYFLVQNCWLWNSKVWFCILFWKPEKESWWCYHLTNPRGNITFLCGVT